MKITVLKTFVCVFAASLIFTSCQKETNSLQEVSSQEIIEKAEGTTTLQTIQSNNKLVAKTLDATLAPVLQAVPAKPRASAGARALGCGAFEVASNHGTGNSYNFYGFNGEDEFYYFDVAFKGTFVVDLFDLSADLDLFLLKRIGGKFQVIDYSANYYSNAERMINDLSVGSYAILVDAYAAGISSKYKITVKCLEALTTDATYHYAESDYFDTYRNGDKIAEVSGRIMRFDPNQSNDPRVNAFNTIKVLPGMKPILFLDHFKIDKPDLSESRTIRMKIPHGKNARLTIEKSLEDGIAGTCIFDLERDGSIWVRVQGRWHKSQHRYPQGDWIEVTITHLSDPQEFAFSISKNFQNITGNYRPIFKLTSDLQVEATAAGSRGYAGISLQTFDSNSQYEVDYINSSIVSPAGGSSRVKKKEITIEIN